MVVDAVSDSGISDILEFERERIGYSNSEIRWASSSLKRNIMKISPKYPTSGKGGISKQEM